MAVGMRGRGSKPANKIVKIKKNSTPSSRKHHFESFSQRVAKLNINPVRQARRHDLNDTEDETSNSYFKKSLQEWQDLNLTENFTGFARDVQPLCETFPQILHYQDRIVDIVVDYLEKKDALSLEPLLSLIAHLAHDLGARFEKHFARMVTVVSRLAAQHHSIEVIEWSFNCLAWLFKYLSKLLIPDLRPLFDLVAPLLGRERQKPFVARFAAEAMSFLIRKAGAVYERNPQPLVTIVGHALEDLIATADRGDTTLYSQGLMAMFTEAVKWVQKGLHASAAAIIRCLIQQTFRLSKADDDLSYSPDEVLIGVLTAVSHHVSDENFKPVLHLLLHGLEAEKQPEVNNLNHSSLCAEILFVVVSTRKEAKDLDWSPIINTLDGLIEGLPRQDASPGFVLKKIARTFATVISLAPPDTVIPHLHIIDRLSLPPWEEHFLALCIYSADLNSERFRTLLLPHFQRFASYANGYKKCR